MTNTTKLSKSKIMALLLAITLISSIWVFTGAAFISGQSPNTNKADYVTFEGTAGTDSYSSQQYSYQINQWAHEQYDTNGGSELGSYLGTLYSYTPANVYFNAGKSLRIGMTEYGEFATAANTGIAYGANAAQWNLTESWASTYINPQYYIQGWLFYMNYTRAGSVRQLEAYAAYSSTSSVEDERAVYSWPGYIDPQTAYSAGTLVSGNLVTSGVEVLYDSARLAVGRTTVIIQDGAFSKENVAMITFTVIFDKTTKYAIVYKDVKILLDQKVLDQINDIAFNERYELDLARWSNPSNQAYIHYYSNYGTSVYQHPLTGTNGFDVVNAFDPANQYNYFAAYWPVATQYAVYTPIAPINLPTGLGYNWVLPLGTQVADIPGAPNGPGEPSTPWVVVQWQYNNTQYPNMLNFLAKSTNREIRFVEVIGMTDYNKDPNPSTDANAFGKDTIASGNLTNAGPGNNNVDTEIQYLLAKVFNPEDLTATNSMGQNGIMDTMWTGVGQASLATDSAGASMMSAINVNTGVAGNLQAPLALFDKNDTTGKGTIPYGLDSFGGTYIQSVSQSNDIATTYQRTGLTGFAFGYSTSTDPQPVAGGFSSPVGYWYPSKDPLTERWTTTYTLSQYDTITWHPNGITTVGGEKANWLSRYFNDFNFALDRETGTMPTTASAAVTPYYSLVNGGVTYGFAPTSNPTGLTLDFFPLSTWNTANWAGATQTLMPITTFGYQAGTAIISIARDNNGTRGITVAGWDARDTYWASAWASQWLKTGNTAWVPKGTVSIILQMTYASGSSEPTFNIARALGTITEMGTNAFATNYGFDAITGPATWTGTLGSLSSTTATTLTPTQVWWYAKLPTTSTALVDFDGST